jgi:hypothetical protein
MCDACHGMACMYIATLAFVRMGEDTQGEQNDAAHVHNVMAQLLCSAVHMCRIMPAHTCVDT